VSVGSTLTKTIGGAVLNKIGGDRNDNAEAIYQEVAAGASIVKANNVTFEAQAMLTLVMGASTLTITPASVMVAGVSVKIDGATVSNGIVVDN
jgi:type VI secretion system secreted protein VgrG